MAISGIGFPAVPLAAMVATCATACSEVRRHTYVVDLTTDETAHTVELWRPTKPYPEQAYAYSLRFPQAFYVFEDNHFYRKQTKIDLLLDKATFRPWTRLLSEETGILEPLNYPKWKTSQLTKAALQSDVENPRRLLVTIRGVEREVSLSAINLRARSSERLLGDWNGFRVVMEKRPFSPTLPGIHGHTSTGPLVWVYCPDYVKNCRFRRQLGPSAVSFSLPRERANEAVALSDRLLAFLRQHVVPQGTKP